MDFPHYIEFFSYDNFENFPYEERLTITFITSGSMNIQLNDCLFKIEAPTILCLTMEDKLQVIKVQNVSAQSFCFHPDFFNTVKNKII